MSTDYNVTVAGDGRSRNGEAPFYDAGCDRLIYIDYLAGDVTIYTPSDNSTQRIHVYDGWISLAIPVEGQPNKLLVTVGKNKIATFDLATRKIQLIKEYELNGRVFHDGKCDARGRLWVGGAPVQSESSFGSGNGYLYQFDGETLDIMSEDFSLPNGLTWSNDNKYFFFADSLRGVWKFDFHLDKGTISNKKLFIDFYAIAGFKKCDEHFLNGDFVDGMTMDADDNLWIVSYGSSKVCKFNTVDGGLLEIINLPVKTITSLCFGGCNWNEIYVTSYWDVSWITDTKPFDEDDRYGKLFKITSDVKRLRGIPMFPYRLK